MACDYSRVQVSAGANTEGRRWKKHLEDTENAARWCEGVSGEREGGWLDIPEAGYGGGIAGGLGQVVILKKEPEGLVFTLGGILMCWASFPSHTYFT